LKANELAPRFRRKPSHIELDPDFPDPSVGQFQAIERREEIKQAKLRLAEVHQAVSPYQSKLLDDALAFYENLSSDEDPGPYRQGPKRLEFNCINIAAHLTSPHHTVTPEHVSDTFEAARKNLDRRGMMPNRKRRRRVSPSAT
jgi:hypothetical protein